MKKKVLPAPGWLSSISSIEPRFTIEFASSPLDIDLIRYLQEAGSRAAPNQ